MRRPLPRLALTLLAVCLALLLPLAATAQDKPAPTVAILPFEVHAAESLAHLKQGIRDMLGSRLAAGAKVTVLSRAKVDEATGGQSVQPAQQAALAQKLGADYLITGSFTSLGGGGSLDAKVLDARGGATETFFATAQKEDEVIGSINTLAWDMGEKLFGAKRPATAATAVASTAAPAAPQPAYQTAHPERAFMNPESGGSYGTPFIRPMGITGAFGFTKTQNLRLTLMAMDVGDVDGDGANEMVLAGPGEVTIHRLVGNRLQKIGAEALLIRYKIHHVSIADVDRNGLPEIYVSATDDLRPQSFVLEWRTDHFERIFDNIPYYLRAMQIAGEGLVAVGQRSGVDRLFEPGLFVMDRKAGHLVEGKKILVPDKINLFDFVMADLDVDGRTEIISIDQGDQLSVMSQSGKVLWKSADYFGGTKRYVGKEKDKIGEADDDTGRIYIPARIIVTDINDDKKPDIVVNKNLSAASRVMKNFKSYPNGEIYGLAWNGISLAELWHTRTIDGYIADYQMLPLSEPGKAELHVGVILNTGSLDFLSDNESTILTYPLDFRAAAKEDPTLGK